jgi:hypothetical protein
MIHNLAGVIDTGNASYAGINDTGNACISGLVYTGDAPSELREFTSVLRGTISEKKQSISRYYSLAVSIQY